MMHCCSAQWDAGAEATFTQFETSQNLTDPVITLELQMVTINIVSWNINTRKEFRTERIAAVCSTIRSWDLIESVSRRFFRLPTRRINGASWRDNTKAPDSS